MAQNRLKTLRKVKRKTQTEIASVIGINQNTYSYWETGKVKIDNESLSKLAEYYGVSVDFLLGRRYRMRKSPDKWHPSLREDYYTGDVYLKEYMEYIYGDIVYLDVESQQMTVFENEEKPAITEDGELEDDVIIFHRDGKTQKRKFTKEQMAMLMAMVDAIPETPKEDI